MTRETVVMDSKEVGAPAGAGAAAREMVVVDGNEAAASVAYRASEVVIIYPITPSSPMAEWADQWSAENRKNIWGTVPSVFEMQSEGGAAGALHGALQTGALATTFTASQGLLLMIPNMFKIAGELTPAVFHVTARSLAAQALSIFGDHSDVMAARATGFAMLCSNTVQEVMDLALVAHASTLESRVPFLHFFDGFRTSHEVMKVEELSDEDVRALVPGGQVLAHRGRALSPERPVLRGTAQNPDVFFQGRETVNAWYAKVPAIVQEAMDKLGARTGRAYRLFDYMGAPDAERVLVMMGSGCEAAEEAVKHLLKKGEKVGLLKVRLFRPFSVEHCVKALPASVKTLAVLDRTKEPGSAGEPLYQDIVTAVDEGLAAGVAPFKAAPSIIGGRYGLGSKEFTPAMVMGIFDELKKSSPRNHFTIGIKDDVTGSSLDYDPTLNTEHPGTVRALFYGLGSDGTVGANKNSIKIIGDETDRFVQGYFVYDSKKSGSITVSHLRFGPEPIQSTYLIRSANFVACHQFSFLERYEVLHSAEPGAVFLLNSPYGPEEVWSYIPRSMQEQIIAKGLKFYVIDGYQVARDTGMGGRVNTIMQTCFFAISGILPREEAIAAIKRAIKKTYSKRGDDVVKQNYDAVDKTLENLHQVKVPASATGTLEMKPPVPAEAPPFVQDVLARIIAGRGDDVPVSAMPADGTYPTGTSQWEKRAIALEIPVWDPITCIQCGKCVMACPHAVIRSKVYDKALLGKAPSTFKSTAAKWKDFPEMCFTVQVSPDDCTGCTACTQVCPAKNKANPELKAINMGNPVPVRTQENANWQFFLNLPEAERDLLNPKLVKDIQLMRPLFEFSGACAGCGETPYLKLVSQLFGPRAIIANATGCSSIYGGNLPTTPWAFNKEGRGPAWSNSLFEDNAEFGLGFRLNIDKQAEFARELVTALADSLGSELVKGLLEADQSTEKLIAEQRARVEALKSKLETLDSEKARHLESVADALVKKSVWIFGGDGWAYDIGFGGLDHVLASGRNVNVMVLDTEVYSNTGGQMSKSTPLGAVAKFAAAGKARPKKDLGLIAMTYGNIYVARVALGASDAQCVKAITEAEAYDGPSLIIAYAHCIAQGFDLAKGYAHQRAAVASGHWPLLRFDPALLAEGKNPLQLDSKDPSMALEDYVYEETRYSMLRKSNEAESTRLIAEAKRNIATRWHLYKSLAELKVVEAAG